MLKTKPEVLKKFCRLFNEFDAGPNCVQNRENALNWFRGLRTSVRDGMSESLILADIAADMRERIWEFHIALGADQIVGEKRVAYEDVDELSRMFYERWVKGKFV